MTAGGHTESAESDGNMITAANEEGKPTFSLSNSEVSRTPCVYYLVLKDPTAGDASARNNN